MRVHVHVIKKFLHLGLNAGVEQRKPVQPCVGGEVDDALRVDLAPGKAMLARRVRKCLRVPLVVDVKIPRPAADAQQFLTAVERCLADQQRAQQQTDTRAAVRKRDKRIEDRRIEKQQPQRDKECEAVQGGRLIDGIARRAEQCGGHPDQKAAKSQLRQPAERGVSLQHQEHQIQKGKAVRQTGLHVEAVPGIVYRTELKAEEQETRENGHAQPPLFINARVQKIHCRQRQHEHAAIELHGPALIADVEGFRIESVCTQHFDKACVELHAGAGGIIGSGRDAQRKPGRQQQYCRHPARK